MREGIAYALLAAILVAVGACLALVATVTIRNADYDPAGETCPDIEEVVRAALAERDRQLAPECLVQAQELANALLGVKYSVDEAVASCVAPRHIAVKSRPTGGKNIAATAMQEQLTLGGRMSRFPQLLRDKMQQLGLTRDQAAVRMGIPAVTVGNWLSGKHVPDAVTHKAILDRLDPEDELYRVNKDQD